LLKELNDIYISIYTLIILFTLEFRLRDLTFNVQPAAGQNVWHLFCVGESQSEHFSFQFGLEADHFCITAVIIFYAFEGEQWESPQQLDSSSLFLCYQYIILGIELYMEFNKSHLYHYPLNQEHPSLLSDGVSSHFIQKQNKVRITLFFKFSMKICLYLYKYLRKQRKKLIPYINIYMTRLCNNKKFTFSFKVGWIVFILLAFLSIFLQIVV